MFVYWTGDIAGSVDGRSKRQATKRLTASVPAILTLVARRAAIGRVGEHHGKSMVAVDRAIEGQAHAISSFNGSRPVRIKVQ